MTGLAVETTIRTISKLSRKRLIAKSGRSLVIRDLPGLQALVDGRLAEAPPRLILKT